MSLINQVLKDLDKRNSSSETGKLLSGEVRNSKSPKSKISPVIPVLLLALATAGGYYAWKKYYQPATQPAVAAITLPPAPAKPPEPPAPAPTPAPQPPVASGTSATPTEAAPANQDGANAATATQPTAADATAQPTQSTDTTATLAPPSSGTALSASQAGVMLSLDFPKAIKYKLFALSAPNRVVIDLEDAELTPELEHLPAKLTSTDSDITDIRVGRFTPNITRIVLGLKGALPDAKSSMQAADNGHHQLVVQWGHPVAALSALPQHFLDMDKELKPSPRRNAHRDSDNSPIEHRGSSTHLRPSRALSEKSNASSDEAAAPSKPLNEKPTTSLVRGSSSEPIKVMSALQRSDNFYHQAITMLQQGRVVEAKETLRKSLIELPCNHAARQLLVGLLVEESHQGDAINLLREGLKLAPDQIAFSMSLARLQIEASDRQGALATLQEGLPHAAENAEYHAFMAALLQREERHEDAIAHYLVALKSNPAMPNWLIGIGISLQSQGKLADAAEAFNRAKRTGALSPDLVQFVDQRLGQINQQTR